MSATRYKRPDVDIFICIEMARERNRIMKKKHPVELAVRVSWSPSLFFTSTVIPKSLSFLVEMSYKIDINHPMQTIPIYSRFEMVLDYLTRVEGSPPAR